MRRWAVRVDEGVLEWDGMSARPWKAWCHNGRLVYHGSDPGAAMEELLSGVGREPDR